MDSLRDLSSCGSFSAFFEKALKLHYSGKEKVNLSAFSKAAGFSSRSYLSEILSGKKGLSRDSLLRIKSAFRLPKPYLQFFELLAYSENPSIRPVGMTEDFLEQKLKLAQGQMSFYLAKKGKPSPALVRKTAAYQVYAALGSLEKGATMGDIISRSGLPETTVRECLEVMVQEKAAEKRGNRYLALTGHLDLFGLKSTDGLSQLIGEACDTVRRNRSRLIDNPENLVFFSAFSVKKSDMKALRQKMKAAVMDVLEEFQEDEGDSVRKILFSMH